MCPHCRATGEGNPAYAEDGRETPQPVGNASLRLFRRQDADYGSDARCAKGFQGTKRGSTTITCGAEEAKVRSDRGFLCPRQRRVSRNV